MNHELFAESLNRTYSRLEAYPSNSNLNSYMSDSISNISTSDPNSSQQSNDTLGSLASGYLNQTNDSNEEPVPVYMQHMTTILVILHFSVFVSGLVGNALVCLSVYRNKSLQTVTNYYIVNLAVADFLVILICLPPTVYWDITLTWNFGLVLCKLVLYLQSISVSVSVLTLTCISIDRWYAICKPLEFCSTKYRAKITIALIWLASLLIASPDVIFLTTKPQYEENDIVYMDCTYSWPERNTKVYQLCIMSILFVVPFILMSISYFHIVNVLWRNETITEQLLASMPSQSLHEDDHQHQPLGPTTSSSNIITNNLGTTNNSPLNLDAYNNTRGKGESNIPHLKGGSKLFESSPAKSSLRLPIEKIEEAREDSKAMSVLTRVVVAAVSMRREKATKMNIVSSCTKERLPCLDSRDSEMVAGSEIKIENRERALVSDACHDVSRDEVEIDCQMSDGKSNKVSNRRHSLDKYSLNLREYNERIGDEGCPVTGKARIEPNTTTGARVEMNYIREHPDDPNGIGRGAEIELNTQDRKKDCGDRHMPNFNKRDHRQTERLFRIQTKFGNDSRGIPIEFEDKRGKSLKLNCDHINGGINGKFNELGCNSHLDREDLKKDRKHPEFKSVDSSSRSFSLDRQREDDKKKKNEEENKMRASRLDSISSWEIEPKFWLFIKCQQTRFGQKQKLRSICKLKGESENKIDENRSNRDHMRAFTSLDLDDEVSRFGAELANRQPSSWMPFETLKGSNSSDSVNIRHHPNNGINRIEARRKLELDRAGIGTRDDTIRIRDPNQDQYEYEYHDQNRNKTKARIRTKEKLTDEKDIKDKRKGMGFVVDVKSSKVESENSKKEIVIKTKNERLENETKTKQLERINSKFLETLVGSNITSRSLLLLLDEQEDDKGSNRRGCMIQHSNGEEEEEEEEEENSISKWLIESSGASKRNSYPRFQHYQPSPSRCRRPRGSSRYTKHMRLGVDQDPNEGWRENDRIGSRELNGNDDTVANQTDDYFEGQMNFQRISGDQCTEHRNSNVFSLYQERKTASLERLADNSSNTSLSLSRLESRVGQSLQLLPRSQFKLSSTSRSDKISKPSNLVTTKMRPQKLSNEDSGVSDGHGTSGNILPIESNQWKAEEKHRKMGESQIGYETERRKSRKREGLMNEKSTNRESEGLDTVRHDDRLLYNERFITMSVDRSKEMDEDGNYLDLGNSAVKVKKELGKCSLNEVVSINPDMVGKGKEESKGQVSNVVVVVGHLDSKASNEMDKTGASCLISDNHREYYWDEQQHHKHQKEERQQQQQQQKFSCESVLDKDEQAWKLEWNNDSKLVSPQEKNKTVTSYETSNGLTQLESTIPNLLGHGPSKYRPNNYSKRVTKEKKHQHHQQYPHRFLSFSSEDGKACYSSFLPIDDDKGVGSTYTSNHWASKVSTVGGTSSSEISMMHVKRKNSNNLSQFTDDDDDNDNDGDDDDDDDGDNEERAEVTNCYVGDDKLCSDVVSDKMETAAKENGKLKKNISQIKDKELETSVSTGDESTQALMFNCHQRQQQQQQHQQQQRQTNRESGFSSSRLQRNSQSSNHRPSSGCNNVTNNNISYNNSRFCKFIESRKKAAKMLIVIVVMFGLCYLPVHFLNTLRYTIGLPQNDLTTIASLVSHWLCYFNSAINPLIYNLMSGKFRHEFANLFFCRCFRTTPNSNTKQSYNQQNIAQLKNENIEKRINGMKKQQFN